MSQPQNWDASSSDSRAFSRLSPPGPFLLDGPAHIPRHRQVSQALFPALPSCPWEQPLVAKSRPVMGQPCGGSAPSPRAPAAHLLPVLRWLPSLAHFPRSLWLPRTTSQINSMPSNPGPGLFLGALTQDPGAAAMGCECLVSQGRLAPKGPLSQRP